MHDDRLTQTQKDVGGLSYSCWICTCRSVCGTWLNSSVYMTSANTNTQTHTCAQKPEGANSQKYTYAHTYISYMFLWRKEKTSLHPCFHRDVFLHVGKWCLWPMEPALLKVIQTEGCWHWNACYADGGGSHQICTFIPVAEGDESTLSL